MAPEGDLFEPRLFRNYLQVFDICTANLIVVRDRSYIL